MQLCPVCGWEDAPGEFPYNGSNGVPISEAQQNFILTGACEAHLKDVVRSPFPKEARSAHWLSMEDMRKATIAFIENAFATVRLDGGMSLAQQQIVWDWHTKEQFQAAAAHPSLRWQDIPDDVFAELPIISLLSLDSSSVRMHLPAFMRFTLRSPIYPNVSGNLVLDHLEKGPEPKSDDLPIFHSLNEYQRQAVAAFLSFFEYYDDHQASIASKGLRAGWDRYVPEFVRAARL